MTQPISKETTIKQFTQQAIPFERMPAHSDHIERIVELATTDTRPKIALDLACGPGLVATALAPHCDAVVGIDLTQAMIDRARQKSEELEITNASFLISDAEAILYPDNHFDFVVTRYSVHHFSNPSAAFAEVARVIKPKSSFIVVDMLIQPEHSKRFNDVEHLRDPSHVQALTASEMTSLFSQHGFELHRIETHEVEIDLEEQLVASFPQGSDASAFRDSITNDIALNDLGLNATREEGRVKYRYPIGIYVSTKR